MSRMGWILLAILVLLVLAGGAYYVHAQQRTNSEKVVQVHWVVAHQPVSLFNRAQQTFAQVFNENSVGMKIVVDSYGPSDLASSSSKSQISTPQVFQLLNSNTVQMASVVLSTLHTQDPLVGVFGLPYLFTDYTSAQQVLEGAPGQQVLDSISSSTSAHALAFTFSGGLEVIQTRDKEIDDPADLQGLKIGTQNPQVQQDVLSAMGADVVPLDGSLNDQQMEDLLFSGKVDGLEYTYTRLYFATTSPQKSIINETYHGMFLTTILVSDSFFSSLSPQNQAALQKAATAAARVERADSLQLASTTREELISNGDKVITPTAQGDAQFKADTAPVYTKYAPIFGQSLIDSIRAAVQN